MKEKTKLYIIIIGLIALLFVRECKHAQRMESMKQHNIELEYIK